MEDFKMTDIHLKELRRGQKVTGTVVQVYEKEIYLDIHSFTEGIMHLDHYTKDKNITSFIGIVNVGDQIDCEVAKINEEHIYLSRLNEIANESFQKVVDAFNNHQKITVTIVKEVQGKGFSVDFEGSRLFLPHSQAPSGSKLKDKLEVYVIEATPERKNAVVSRKLVEQEELEENKKAEYDSINVGDAVKATIVKVEKFGVFVRFKYNKGLVRINQLSHTYTADITNEYKVGDEIEVKVLGKDNGKFTLSRKALLPTPYEAYCSTIKVGDTVTGKVTNKLPFGLLIELAPNVKGLLHQSEFSHNPNDNFSSHVKIGDEVTCAILNFNAAKEKVSLSRRALIDNPWKRVEARVGDVVEVLVKEVNESGLVVETLGVDGFVPANEVLTPSQNGQIKDYYDAGDRAKAEIIEIKPHEWKLRLSIRKLAIKEERRSYEKYLNAEDMGFKIGDVVDKNFKN